jgi:tetratricopeptide (TPR) repeat protein
MKEAQLKSLQQQIATGQFEQALQHCRAELETNPKDVDLLYMAAVCERYLGGFDRALTHLRQLKSLQPEHGRALQEEGHVYRDSDNPDAALRAYALACQYNPALIAAWRSQHQILQQGGRKAQAQFVENRLQELEALPKPLLAAMDLIHQGKLLKAEDICRQFLQRVPHNIEGMRLLADIGIRLGMLDDAEFLLESATRLAPDHSGARVDYVNALRKKQKFDLALEQAEQLLAAAPDNVQFQSLVAVAKMQAGDFDRAIQTFDTVLDAVPRDPITLTSRGHALKTVGRTDEAVTSYQQALQNYPSHGEAWYALANLKTYRFSEDEVNEMLGQKENADLGYMDRVYLSFALGKAFEDRRDYDQAFHQLEIGNGLKKAQSRYSADRMREEFEAQKRICSSELMSRRHASGHDAADPIFIVGLPRAGSTLLEQILASHSQVEGTLELPNILTLSQRLRRGGDSLRRGGDSLRRGGDSLRLNDGVDESLGGRDRYPAILESLSNEQLRAFGEQYIEDTQVHRHGTPLFIDKMPNNFRHIGLIKLILPNAKIIDARRHPMSCCFSIYKQLFAEGQEFSYSLADVGRYYRDYLELMTHWQDVLPGEILTVQHEDVVDDLEGQVRRMLDFCGLPFEEACLRYYETERDVRTPSSEQVRQPIFRTALDQWKPYEPYLAPLQAALEG